MSASDHLGPQWHQLDMYKTAKELRGHTLSDVETEKYYNKKAGIAPDPDIDKKVMAQKLKTAKTTKLYESVKRIGVKEPVSIGEGRFLPYKRGIVADGHHRIAAAYKINKNMIIPVEHIGLEPYTINGKTYNS